MVVANSADYAIKVEKLGKRFKIYRKPWDRVAEWASGNHLQLHADFAALQEISFEVGRGECVGILGVNGSGKSTLLKILTGALYPTAGNFEIRGRILSLLELGTGLNMELTGRQNVVHSSQLLGFPADYATTKMEAIAAFSELGEFFDRPVKMYSSGMLVRLAFSMYASFEPDIFVIDEALSVGDVFFQQKCFARLHEIMGRGTTLVFVSHDTVAVQNLCDRAMLLEHGRLQFIGEPEQAVSRYYASMGRQSRGEVSAAPAEPPAQEVRQLVPAELRAEVWQHNILPQAKNRHGERGFEAVAASVTDAAGRPTWGVQMMEAIHLRILLKAKRTIAKPSVGLQIYDRMNNLIFAAGNRQLGVVMEPLQAGEERLVEFTLNCSIQAGQYTLNVGCAEPVEGNLYLGIWHDVHEGMGPLDVTWGSDRAVPFHGIAKLPLSMKVIGVD